MLEYHTLLHAHTPPHGSAANSERFETPAFAFAAAFAALLQNMQHLQHVQHCRIALLAAFAAFAAKRQELLHAQMLAFRSARSVLKRLKCLEAVCSVLERSEMFLGRSQASCSVLKNFEACYECFEAFQCAGSPFR